MKLEELRGHEVAPEMSINVEPSPSVQFAVDRDLLWDWGGSRGKENCERNIT